MKNKITNKQMICFSDAKHSVVLDKDYCFMDKQDRLNCITEEDRFDKKRTKPISWFTAHYGCDIVTGKGQIADEVYNVEILAKTTTEELTANQICAIKNILMAAILMKGEKAFDNFLELEKRIKKVLNISVKLDLKFLSKSFEGDLTFGGNEAFMNTESEVIVNKNENMDLENSLNN